VVWPLLLVGPLLSAAGPLAAADLPRERVVYTTRRPVAWDIYLFESGSGPRKLTEGPALNYDATFSPDGRWVVFCSERSGNPHLYAVDLQNLETLRPLTSGQFMDSAPAFAPDGRSLFFMSDRDGSSNVFMMPFRPDDAGTEVRAVNLTGNSAANFRPAVSPDGRTVAFTSDRDFDQPYPYKAEIYVMDRDGSNQRRLTNLQAMSGSPAWSRDGRTLYFYSNAGGPKYRIWAMDSDGNHPHVLSSEASSILSALSPAVMPDDRIAFSAETPDGSVIMSMASDGSGARIESGTQPDCRSPAFEPAGRRMVCTGRGSLEGQTVGSNGRPLLAGGAHNEVRLPDRILEVQGVFGLFGSSSPDGHAFVTGQPFKPDDLTSMHLVINRADGSGEHEIFRPTPGTSVWATSWARDADLIAFTVGPIFANDDAVVDIWTIHSDGTEATNVTQGKFKNNAFPDLTADGRQIVFRSTRDGNKELYLMNADGTNVRQITHDPSGDTMPAISPRGDLVAFASRGFRLYLQSLKNGGPDGPARILEDYAPTVHPRFSPDGKWVVFASRKAWLNDEPPLSTGHENQPYGEIFAVPVDGSSPPVRLTHNKWEDSVPSWGVRPGR
jgi:Tol biopolymer transport system component